MAVALESVVKQLTDSGIIAQGQLENFIPPKANPTSVEELIAELVKNNHLTKFQAAQVANGRAKSLILGGYTILDRIGAGGMGQVFKALHRRMDRLVAIKMLPNAMTKDAAATARFEREVRAAAKLNHSNIVTAYDADQANGVHFLVMECVEGSDLSQLVKKNGPFPVAKAVHFVLQAARGLEFAHKKGVVHRDIKPANLLLDNEGTVKILDMGLARIESDGNVTAQAELTGTGAVMGTVDFMAPEQGMSTKHADARADIYSLGCSLYYLIVGKAVYGGETVAAKLIAHHNNPIPDLRLECPEVSEQLDAVFKKLVAKRLEDRYQTMTEVIADLERLGGNSGTASDPYAATTALSSGALAALKGIDVSRTTAKTAATRQVDAAKPSGGKLPPWKNVKVLVGAGAAGFLCLLLGVIVIVRNKDGKEVARLEVADGHAVEVQPTTSTVVPVKASAGQPNKPWNTPAFQVWMKDVAALPAEEQVKAVSKKLMELNPGFDGTVTGADGKGTPKIENGLVTELRFVTDNVKDISPVQALAGLRVLICSTQAGQTTLADLSPLEGMKLIRLHCDNTLISDLLPLRGMPLTSLVFGGSQISDLSPLKDMPLTQLHCWSGKVSSLSPLQGLPLVSLLVSDNPITDLAPLKGMPLTSVGLGSTSISDLSPLHECKSLISVKAFPSNVTATEVAALQKALPNCEIEWGKTTKVSTPQPTASGTK